MEATQVCGGLCANGAITDIHPSDQVLVGGTRDADGHLVAEWIDVNPVASHAVVVASSPSAATIRLTNSSGEISDGLMTLHATVGMTNLATGTTASMFPVLRTGQRFYFIGSLAAPTDRSAGWATAFETG